MIDILGTMAANLAIPASDLIIFIATCGLAVFFAMGFRQGLIMLFLGYTVLFVTFYLNGLDYVNAIILMFAILAVMALSFVVNSNPNPNVI